VRLRAIERHTRGNTGFRQHRLAQRQPAQRGGVEGNERMERIAFKPARSAAVMVKL
jgi:hypothetical protein